MLCIIQARMSSKRLPGKILKEVNSQPLLYYLIKSIKNSRKIKKIIVATSNDYKDLKIINYCKKNNINWFSGPLKNVALRFKKIIEVNKYNEFIRISADSPLLDYKILDRAISIYNKAKPDIVSNVLNRSFPKGQSVEIVKKSIFLKNFKKFKKNEDFEHVTRYFYNNKSKFDIINFKNKKNLSNINLSVDTYKDFKLIKKILSKIKNNNLKKILEILNEK